MPRKCCAPGCRSNYTGSEVSVFRFPKDQDRQDKWIRAIHRKDLAPSDNTVLCEKHFDPEFVIREDTLMRPDGTVIKVNRGTPKLSNDAIPSIFPNQPKYRYKELPPKHTTPHVRKNGQLKRDEEEDWFSAVPDDWEDESKEWNRTLLEPVVQISEESNSWRGNMRKSGGGRGYGKKRGVHLAVDVDRESPIEEVPVKQEKPDSPEHMVEIPPEVSMNILPNVAEYPAPISVFPLAPAVLPLYMAQSQMPPVLPSANFSSGNPDVPSNSDCKSAATVQNFPLQAGDETDYTHTNVEANIMQEIPDSENLYQVIGMPFQSELQNDGSFFMQREVVTASPLPAIEDFTDNNTRSRHRNKSQEQTNARASVSFNNDQSLSMSHNSLRELTNLLVKLNNKSLRCIEKIQILKEEYDRMVAVIGTEKKANDKELDRVLFLIKNWKKRS